MTPAAASDLPFPVPPRPPPDRAARFQPKTFNDANNRMRIATRLRSLEGDDSVLSGHATEVRNGIVQHGVDGRAFIMCEALLQQGKPGPHHVERRADRPCRNDAADSDSRILFPARKQY